MLPLGSIRIKWDPILLPDLSGYRVHYGYASGQYDRTIEVGKATEYIISGLLEDTPYFFTVTAYDTAGNESSNSAEATVTIRPAGSPQNLALTSYVFPNPLRKSMNEVHIRYTLPEPSEVKLEIYDLGNNLVRTLLHGEVKAAGEHVEDVWDGRDESGEMAANGVYFCRIQTNRYTHIVKIAVLR